MREVNTMEQIIDRTAITKMMAMIEEEAKEEWPAMFKTYPYLRVTAILSKSDEEITFADKESLRLNLMTLADCLGLDYYRLITVAYQK
jgi:hypothetical protein